MPNSSCKDGAASSGVGIQTTVLDGAASPRTADGFDRLRVVDAALVSVVIPSYNYGHFVCEAVESALAQTYPNIEVIVVDDGSTDNTRQRLAHYGDRIRYVYQENRGLSAARNTGVRHAAGEWIALLDADDLWHPQKIETQLNAVREFGQVGLIGSPPADELCLRLPPAPRVQHMGVRDILLSLRFGPSSTLIRRDCLETVGGFDEELRSVEDRDMWLRLAVRFPVVFVESPCWLYRIHGGQMSRAAWRMYFNYCKVLEGFFSRNPAYGALRRLGYGYANLDASIAFLDAGERTEALKFLVRSLACWPWPLRLSNRAAWLRMKLLIRLTAGERVFRRLTALRPRIDRSASTASIGGLAADCVVDAPQVCEPGLCRNRAL